MQSSTAKQDIETGAAKSTSTPQMKILVFLSAAAAVVQAVALLGWVTLKLDAGIVQVSFLSMDPPITSIIFFAALFTLPTALATPVVMFTHWKPAFKILGSQQFTDSLRGQFAAPFRMKYLYTIQAFINGVALISLKYDFYWPAILNITNIVLYCLGLVFVIQHFKNPNVPTDLASTAGSILGSTGAVDRIDSLERDVKTLKHEMEALKNQVVALQASSV
jgi:hypothetical protein